MILDKQMNNIRQIAKQEQYQANHDLYRDMRKNKDKRYKSVAIDFSLVQSVETETECNEVVVEEIDTSVESDTVEDLSRPSSEYPSIMLSYKSDFNYDQGVRAKPGPIKLPDGAIYEGEWLNGKKDGYGILQKRDGLRYEG